MPLSNMVPELCGQMTFDLNIDLESHAQDHPKYDNLKGHKLWGERTWKHATDSVTELQGQMC